VDANPAVVTGTTPFFAPLAGNASTVAAVPANALQYSVVRLQHAKAATAAKAVAEEYKDAGIEVVAVDESSNSIVLRGTAEKVKRIKTFLEKIDTKE
jgi:type II secretory pathway component GspD/PulD (secretin)